MEETEQNEHNQNNQTTCTRVLVPTSNYEKVIIQKTVKPKAKLQRPNQQFKCIMASFLLFPNPPSGSFNPNISMMSIDSAWTNVIEATGSYAARDPTSDLDMCINYLNEIQMFLDNRNSNNLESGIDIANMSRGDCSYLDEPPTRPPPPPPSPIVIQSNGTSHNDDPLTSRRILIRILTTLSEINAVQAIRYGKSRQWKNGANSYTISYSHVSNALNMADEEFVKLLTYKESLLGENSPSTTNNTNIDYKTIQTLQNHISSDCNIIHITNSHFSTQRDKFTAYASSRKSYLELKLQPQYLSRDEIKHKVGHYRWTHNPNPKNDYASIRKNDEMELKEIEDAVVMLDDLECLWISEKVSDMLNGVRHDDSYYRQSRTSINNNVNHDSDVNGNVSYNNQQRQILVVDSNKRYNGIRPMQNLQHPRVSFEEYPDPTNFGWIFTGSCDESFVEFFEKTMDDRPNHNNNNESDDDDDDGGGDRLPYQVKLDFYYTTGSVKTSLFHPIQGQKQLFGLGASITPELYRKILLNPRVHTGQRYHTKRNRPVGGGGSGGGRSGRRGGRGGRGGRRNREI